MAASVTRGLGGDPAFDRYVAAVGLAAAFPAGSLALGDGWKVWTDAENRIVAIGTAIVRGTPAIPHYRVVIVHPSHEDFAGIDANRLWNLGQPMTNDNLFQGSSIRRPNGAEREALRKLSVTYNAIADSKSAWLLERLAAHQAGTLSNDRLQGLLGLKQAEVTRLVTRMRKAGVLVSPPWGHERHWSAPLGPLVAVRDALSGWAYRTATQSRGTGSYKPLDTARALAHPPRLLSVWVLANNAAGTVTVGDLTDIVGIKQPHMSYELRLLRDAGIVGSERHGSHVYYTLYRDALLPWLDWLTALIEQLQANGHPAATPGLQLAAVAGVAIPGGEELVRLEDLIEVYDAIGDKAQLELIALLAKHPLGLGMPDLQTLTRLKRPVLQNRVGRLVRAGVAEVRRGQIFRYVLLSAALNTVLEELRYRHSSDEPASQEQPAGTQPPDTAPASTQTLAADTLSDPVIQQASALADPTVLIIVWELAHNPPNTANVGDLTDIVGLDTIAAALERLRDAALVDSTLRGRNRYYRLTPAGWRSWEHWLDQVISTITANQQPQPGDQ
jgi:DNA-binding transcriptional ArsR family regulator